MTVSIIIPVYNVEPYVIRCINSILNQVYTSLQIILVNDGSTDSSGLICDQIALQDMRIQVIHKANGGLSSARNAGLDACTGEYITFIDSDDWIEPDHIERLVNSIIQFDADIAISGYKELQEWNENHDSSQAIPFPPYDTFIVNQVLEKKEIVETLIGSFYGWNRPSIPQEFSSVCDKLYSARIINCIPKFISERLCISEDSCFNLDAFGYARRIVFTKSYSYNYCIRSTSLTRSYSLSSIEKYAYCYLLLIQKSARFGMTNEATLFLSRIFIQNIFKYTICNKELTLSNLKLLHTSLSSADVQTLIALCKYNKSPFHDLFLFFLKHRCRFAIFLSKQFHMLKKWGHKL